MRDDADQSAVNAAIDKVAALKADMQKMRYDHQQKVHGVLTKEQLGKLKDLKKKARCNMPCRPGGKGMGPGFGDTDG